jgi:hypothetical protein
MASEGGGAPPKTPFPRYPCSVAFAFVAAGTSLLSRYLATSTPVYSGSTTPVFRRRHIIINHPYFV